MFKQITFWGLHFTVKMDLVEVAYYLEQAFHLLYDKGVTPAEVLPYFSSTL